MYQHFTPFYHRITFHCTEHCLLLVCSSVDGTCYFHLLVFMNHVATNIQVCRFLYGHMVSSLGHKYLGRGTAEPHSGCTFWETATKVFSSVCVRFQSYGQWMRVPTAPRARQHLLMPVFHFSRLTENKVVSHCGFGLYDVVRANLL